ncbi:MAG: hypothetical protein WAU15_02735 [Nitrosomonas sp.]
MNNQVMLASGKIVVPCNCKLSPLPPGQIHDLVEEWIADHPYHTRKEHILAYGIFKWLERRSRGGCE